MAERVTGKLFGVSSYKGSNSIMNYMTLYKPLMTHSQMPSYWGAALPYINLGGAQFSPYIKGSRGGTSGLLSAAPAVPSSPPLTSTESC